MLDDFLVSKGPEKNSEKLNKINFKEKKFQQKNFKTKNFCKNISKKNSDKKFLKIYLMHRCVGYTDWAQSQPKGP